jgi:hypothetical protein
MLRGYAVVLQLGAGGRGLTTPQDKEAASLKTLQ